MTPPTLLFLSILLMIAADLAWPAAEVVPCPYNLAGLLPVAFGVVWNIWADRLFKRAGTTVKPDRRPSVLVSDGPYRFSRHPMYVGMASVAGGVAVLLGSLTPFAVAAALVALFAVKFVPAEERAMEAAFGRRWREYSSHVRRWI